MKIAKLSLAILDFNPSRHAVGVYGTLKAKVAKRAHWRSTSRLVRSNLSGILIYEVDLVCIAWHTPPCNETNLQIKLLPAWIGATALWQFFYII
jgi:hypothetical protein